MILHIETSGNVCSVALGKDGILTDSLVSYEPNAHSKVLANFIDDILKRNNIKPTDLQAIAISEGPGSYTGLRIGVSIAKGMAYSLDIPLIAIDTLMLMSVDFIQKHPEIIPQNPVLCPMIDARRMEVFTAFYDVELNKLSETTNMIIDEFSFQTPLQYRPIAFFGNGAEKCKKIITHGNALFFDNIFPLAKNMLTLAYQKFIDKNFVDVAYFEPFYLKPFIATTPKNKLL